MLAALRQCVRLWRADRAAASTPLRYLYHCAAGRQIWAHPHASLTRASNIANHGLLMVGTDYYGFAHDRKLTLVRANGLLTFRGPYSIGRGCCLNIGSQAEATFGTGYVNPNTTFVIKHRLTVGDDTAISWNCMFVDADWHELTYDGRRPKDSAITVGDRVWIGCNTTLLAGAAVPNGCVVGAGSVVTRAFAEPNTLIASNPARVVRTGVSWT